MRIAGLILAGGKSTRMGGGQKALLPLAGIALLDRVIARLAPQVDEIAINANRDLDRYRAAGLPLVSDTVPDFAGPLAGVLAGMRWAAPRGATHVASVAADTPFFPPDLVAQLGAGLSPEARIAMAVTPDPARGQARHPTFALWPVDLADDLEASLLAGIRKIIAWSDRHGTARVTFPARPYDPFFNVNTPDDMQKAERIAAAYMQG